MPFGIMYALLWWARGILVFLILSEFQPRYPAFNLLAGALVIAHASDGSLQWVGQMNQFGVITWMLLAFWAGLRSLSSRTWLATTVCLGLAIFFLHMSLWSYEAQLPIVCLLPLTLVALPNRPLIHRGVLVVSWYMVVAIYIAQSALRYLAQTDSAYQQGVLRQGGLDLAQLAGDWWFNLREGLHFSQWASTLPSAEVLAPASAVSRSPIGLSLGVLAGVIGLLLLAWRWGRHSPNQHETVLPGIRRLLALLGVGVSLYSLSFPVFLLLESAKSLWRTQLIAGLGYGLMIVSAAALLANFIPRRWPRIAALGLLCAVPLFFGMRAALKRGEFHYGVWERHRFAIAQVLHLAPDVAPGTTILLTNVPSEGSPFGDNMWYLVALQLAYPKRYIAGAYFHIDGSPAPSFNLTIDGKDWVWNGVGWPPEEPRRFPLAQTLIIQFSLEGNPSILREVPPYLPGAGQWDDLYSPDAARRSGPPSLDYGHRRYLRSGLVK